VRLQDEAGTFGLFAGGGVGRLELLGCLGAERTRERGWRGTQTLVTMDTRLHMRA